jgi:hypothetical protein
MVDICALIIPRNAFIMSLRRLLLDRSEILLRQGRKTTHAHLMNKTYP